MYVFSMGQDEKMTSGGYLSMLLCPTKSNVTFYAVERSGLDLSAERQTDSAARIMDGEVLVFMSVRQFGT